MEFPFNNAVSQVVIWFTAFGLTGAVASAGMFYLLKTFAKEWIKSQFDSDLEASKAANSRELEKLKSEYQRETERLRSEIGRLLDRATKLHQRQYEVLPEAWALLSKARGAVGFIIAGFQKVPNFDMMSGAEIEDLLASSDLKPYQIDRIRDGSNQQDLYMEYTTAAAIASGFRTTTECRNYIILNGVFIEENIYKIMFDTCTALNAAMVYRQQAERPKVPIDARPKALENFDKAETLGQRLIAQVRLHLWDTQISDPSESDTQTS